MLAADINLGFEDLVNTQVDKFNGVKVARSAFCCATRFPATQPSIFALGDAPRPACAAVVKVSAAVTLFGWVCGSPVFFAGQPALARSDGGGVL